LKKELTKINLGSEKNLQQVKISVGLKPGVSYQLIEFSKGVQGHLSLDLQ
jgi:hypothetical protein